MSGGLATRRPGTARGLLVLAAVVAALAGGCGREASHERMLVELADIAARAAAENIWMGNGRLKSLEAELAELEAGTAPIRRAKTLHRLADAELAYGYDDAAVAHFEEMLTLVREQPRAPPFVLSSALLVVGAAHLRVGENRNCVCNPNADRCRFPIQGRGVHDDDAPAHRAVELFTELMSREPDSVEGRWLLNIAHMTLGDYPDGVPAEHRIEPAVFDSAEEFPRFHDVAQSAGVATLSLSGAALAEDYDGDGHLDLVVSSWDPTKPLRFFRGRGDGRFDERSEEAGFEGLLGGLNGVHADYDGDGDVDIYVLRGAWLGKKGAQANSLLRNDGRGRFTDVTFAVGLGEPQRPSQTAAWADFDGDGDLDLYVGNEEQPGIPNDSQLFRQNADGSFEDVAAALGVANRRFSKGVAWGDYDGDGDPDLYVSNLAMANRLYRNDGSRFVDVAVEAGVEEPLGSFPVWFWDFDNDGSLDLFVAGYASNWSDPTLQEVAGAYLGRATDAETHRLYRGDGRGGFEDVTTRCGLARPTLPMGANFGDLDLDGFPDFYLGTGEPALRTLIPNVMYRNRAGRDFVDVSTAGGFGHLQKGHSVVFADFDEDGDLDVFEQMGGAYRTDVFVDALYENPGFGTHWLRVTLVGTESNRSAIGARIRAEIVESGARRSVYRHVGSGGSFGANPLTQTLGLGAASRVAVLEIHWPTTGETQRFEDVALDRWVRITEGDDELEVVR